MNSAKIVQEDLLTGLNMVNKAIGARVVMPILLNICLTFNKEGLTLFATDLELGIETTVPCKKNDTFTTTIPAKIFTDLIATLQSQVIDLQYNEETETMTVKGTKSKHNIKCIPSKDFPKPPAKNSKEMFSLETTAFKTSISRILFSASEEDNKPVLKSVIFALEKKEVVIYATDGFRASLRTLPVKGLKVESTKIIIPSIVVSEAAKVVDGEKVSFSFNQNLVTITSDKTKVYGQVVAGKAPDHKLIEQMIQGIQSVIVKVNTAELLNLCKQADIFASKDELKFLRMDTDLTGITITGNAQQIGDSTGKINAAVTGAPMNISVSSSFLREFLSAIKTPEVQINMKDSKSPIVVYAEEVPGYWHMIMPVAQ